MCIRDSLLLLLSKGVPPGSAPQPAHSGSCTASSPPRWRRRSGFRTIHCTPVGRAHAGSAHARAQ
eukprot:3668426-Alexandrium_andersonii.AAC.1